MSRPGSFLRRSRGRASGAEAWQTWADEHDDALETLAGAAGEVPDPADEAA